MKAFQPLLYHLVMILTHHAMSHIYTSLSYYPPLTNFFAHKNNSKIAHFFQAAISFALPTAKTLPAIFVYAQKQTYDLSTSHWQIPHGTGSLKRARASCGDKLSKNWLTLLRCKAALAATAIDLNEGHEPENCTDTHASPHANKQMNSLKQSQTKLCRSQLCANQFPAKL